ncbi:MAG: hypothetical protein AB7F19_06680 [Candidatus Babeliales bacterium]
MTPIFKIEKKQLAHERSPVIFLNDKDFINSIGVLAGQVYTVSDDEDCPCCYALICIKNAGDYVVILPDYARLKKYNYDHCDADTFGTIVYGYDLKYPYSLNGGIFYFTIAQYEQLCTLLPNCPKQNQLAHLTKSDVAYILCSELSMNEYITLNFSFTLKLKRELYLLTNAREGKNIVSILQNMLKQHAASEEPVLLTSSPEDDAITIMLNTPNLLEWKPLAKSAQGYTLRLEPGLQSKAT